jgi:hypothetical protein
VQVRDRSRKLKFAKAMPLKRHLSKLRREKMKLLQSCGGASHFVRDFIRPLYRVASAIWHETSKSPEEIVSWLKMAKKRPVGNVTANDARHLLRFVKGVMGMMGAVRDTPEVRALQAAARGLHAQLAAYGRVRQGTVISSSARNVPMCRAESVGEVIRRLSDALVIVVPLAKGSGVSVRMASAYGGGPPEDPHRRRGKGLGGLIIRTGIASCPYRFLPDHETIEFRPARGKPGRKYLIRRTQVEAWKIVNRLSAKMESGKDDWYEKFTGRDANVLRSANAEFLKDCVERERCPIEDRIGNQRWTGYARLRRTAPPWWK